MAYNSSDFKETNVNYINKDFSTLKTSLIEYAKTYFPDSYRDFNEASPGMMLMEMSAYVGDVMSFYIDQQYKEMLLPLAEEKRNIINIANMLGYRVKPVTAAYVDLTVKQIVGASSVEIVDPDYSAAVTIDKGFKITSATDSNIVFETLGIIDFSASGSYNGQTVDPEQTGFDSDGFVNEYTLTRTVRAISGETKTQTFTIGIPSKFLELTIDNTEVTEIISVVDSNRNKWYEVDYLARDKVPIEKHWTEAGRASDSAISGTPYEFYTSKDGTATSVPFSLSFIKTSKRFITKVNDDDTTSLVFGNGIIRTGTTLDQSVLDTEQIGITIPGASEDLMGSIDPLLGDEYSTLGEAPAHTSLIVKYRTGGGLSHNVQSGDLTSFDTVPYVQGSGATLSVTNNGPARGGSSQQSADEIRERALGAFSTQNRCVTKEDYEAKVLSLPARFGNIAKVYASRHGSFSPVLADQSQVNRLQLLLRELYDQYIADPTTTLEDAASVYIWDVTHGSGTVDGLDKDLAIQMISNSTITDLTFPIIELWTLSYDNNKNLAQLTDTNLINQNLKEYLSNFRIMTDEILLSPGYIVNFGVIFDVVAHKNSNRQQVKLLCIQKIIDYFDVSKMHFKQPIYSSQLEYELMGVDGVRSVNYVTITQDFDYNRPDEGSGGQEFQFGTAPLYTYSYSANDGWITDAGQAGYGYRYDFTNPNVRENGIIKSPLAPAVFELKNPSQNIKGIVR